jgi:hypothetical protein
MLVQINRDMLFGIGKHRMRKIDGKSQLITIVGFKPDPFVALFDFDRFFDADKFFGRRLFDDTGRLQQKNERPRTAVHDRHFGAVHFNAGIIDAQT